MSDPTYSIHTVSSQPSLKPQQTVSNASGTNQSATFRSLLSTMLLSGMMSGENGGGGNMMMTVAITSLLEQLMALEVSDDKAAAETADSEAEAATAVADTADITDTVTRTNPDEPSGLPVHGRLTQGYHASHNGLDWGIPVGTPVETTMSGKVVYAGWNNQGYGNLVIVENGPYRTYYAHLSEIPVQLGDWVDAGKVIGLSGNTGNSTGPHLHYEVRKNMVAVDPTPYTERS